MYVFRIETIVRTQTVHLQTTCLVLLNKISLVKMQDHVFLVANQIILLTLFRL